MADQDLTPDAFIAAHSDLFPRHSLPGDGLTGEARRLFFDGFRAGYRAEAEWHKATEHARRDNAMALELCAALAEVARLRADLRHARIEANYWLALYDLADENTATRSYYDALWEDEEHPFVAGDGWESGQPVPEGADAS